LIFENNIDELIELKIERQNLNFLEEFPSAPIDLKITPLVLACFKGNFVTYFIKLKLKRM